MPMDWHSEPRSGEHAIDPRPRCAATLGPLVEAGHAADAALAELARLGVAQVQWPTSVTGLRPRDLDGGARRGLAATLRRLELRLSGVDAWIPPGHFLDLARLDRATAAIGEAIRFAADLATAFPVGQSGSRPVVSVTLPAAAERAAAGRAGDRLDEAVATLAAQGDREGIRLADHAVPSVGGAVAIGVDPAAVLAAGGDPSAAVVSAGERLVTARLVDLFRSGLRGPIGEPGESRLDPLTYRAALDVVGFAGATVIDARQWRDPLAGIALSLERWTGGVWSARRTAAGGQR